MHKRITIMVSGIVIIILIFSVISWRKTPGRQTVVEVPSDSISDDNISIPYSADSFGLAVNKDQILVTSHIPPCDETFSYCFYYNGDEYKGTNFESAGLRIAKRTDLTNESACLTSPPPGYAAEFTAVASTSADTYSSVVFPPLADAAMGRYSNGHLHRVYLRNKLFCYEFETRIGETRYENYPEGDIKKFTDEDRVVVQASLDRLLRNVSIVGGVKVLFP